MHKPTPMMAFDAMYGIAAAGGREEKLFGSCYGPALAAYQRTLIGEGYPSAYLEFPMLERCVEFMRIAPSVDFQFDIMADGSEGRFAMAIRFNYAKVKFTACEPRPAKFYLVLSASELDA